MEGLVKLLLNRGEMDGTAVVTFGGNNLWHLVQVLTLLVASSSDVGVSCHHLRTKNLAFLGLVSASLLFSSKLLLVTPFAISDLDLACLGNTLLIGGGSGVYVFLICDIH